MNQVKIYDNFGSLKKVVSSKELQKRADMLIANPSQYRKTNKNKNSSAKSSESSRPDNLNNGLRFIGRSSFFVVGNIMGIK